MPPYQQLSILNAEGIAHFDIVIFELAMFVRQNRP